MQTALQMVSEGGFHASPMAELAQRSKVAVGTIYHHFSNKEELIAALYLHVKKRSSEALSAALEGKGNAKKKFSTAWTAGVDYYNLNRAEFSFLEQFEHSPLLQQFKSNEVKILSKGLHDFFREGVKGGEIKKAEPVFLAEVFLHFLNMAVRLKLSGAKKAQVDAEVQMLGEMAWAAIKK